MATKVVLPISVGMAVCLRCFSIHSLSRSSPLYLPSWCTVALCLAALLLCYSLSAGVLSLFLYLFDHMPIDPPLRASLSAPVSSPFFRLPHCPDNTNHSRRRFAESRQLATAVQHSHTDGCCSILLGASFANTNDNTLMSLAKIRSNQALFYLSISRQFLSRWCFAVFSLSLFSPLFPVIVLF